MKDLVRTLLALLAVVTTIVGLWFANRPAPPVTATWEDVVAEAERGGYRLISTDDFWERYRNNPDGLLIVDTRQEWEYRTGHIKGAVNFPMEPSWLSRWQRKGELEALLGADKHRAIVFY